MLRCICMVKNATTCCYLTAWGKKELCKMRTTSTCGHLPQIQWDLMNIDFSSFTERAAQFSILTLFPNITEQDAMFLQVLFNPAAWLKGYSVLPTAMYPGQLVKSTTLCCSSNKVDPLYSGTYPWYNVQACKMKHAEFCTKLLCVSDGLWESFVTTQSAVPREGQFFPFPQLCFMVFF